MNDEKNRNTEQLPAQDAQKKQGILSKSMDFLQTAKESISGKDLPRLVEEFTQEMVIVTEGLYADQEALRTATALQGEEQDKLSNRLREQEKRLNELAKKVDSLQARADKRAKRDSGMLRILRQITWIAAIIGGSWVITALIKALVK
ncbi:MAG: hypothetical protein ACOYI6_03175 [Christensenellales bacterium]|jgi:hypothetical protein|nr:hypothetical protein [Clostridiales bacterium]